MKVFKIALLAALLVGCLSAAGATVTSTWSTISTIAGFSVSNAPSGKEIRFSSPHVITNVMVDCTAGTIQVLPSVKGIAIDTTNYIKWASVHVGDQLTFPAFSKSFWIRTTNYLNNTYSVTIQ
jgi:hypothetical protein